MNNMAYREDYLIKNININIINKTIKKYILDHKKNLQDLNLIVDEIQ